MSFFKNGDLLQSYSLLLMWVEKITTSFDLGAGASFVLNRKKFVDPNRHRFTQIRFSQEAAHEDFSVSMVKDSPLYTVALKIKDPGSSSKRWSQSF